MSFLLLLPCDVGAVGHIAILLAVQEWEPVPTKPLLLLATARVMGVNCYSPGGIPFRPLG